LASHCALAPRLFQQGGCCEGGCRISVFSISRSLFSRFWVPVVPENKIGENDEKIKTCDSHVPFSFLLADGPVFLLPLKLLQSGLS